MRELAVEDPTGLLSRPSMILPISRNRISGPIWLCLPRPGIFALISILESKLTQAKRMNLPKLPKGFLFIRCGCCFEVCHSITAFLKGLNYLGPLRAEPQRFYYVPGQNQTLHRVASIQFVNCCVKDNDLSTV